MATPAPPPSPARTSRWHGTRLQTLARRHGSGTEQQRDRLRGSIIRHINAGNVDLDEANAFLQALGLGLVNGPGRVSFRVPVAMATVHKDVETDVGTLQYRIEDLAMFRTRLAGYLGGIRVARLTPADVDTARRYTVVSADLLLNVTVAAYTTTRHLVALATAMLRADLACLREQVGLVDEPTVHDISPLCPAGHDATIADATAAEDGDGDSDGGWDYHPDELDEGTYINYGLDTAAERDRRRVRPGPAMARRNPVDEWTDEVFDQVFGRWRYID